MFLLHRPKPVRKSWHGHKYPLEIKGLPVRVTLAGHIWKQVWVWPKGCIAMAGSPLILAIVLPALTR
jgi:hypothetical protein